MFYRTFITTICLQVAFVVSSFAASSLQGEIRGVDGRPLSGAQVRIDRKDKNSHSIVVTTDAKGRYTANGLTGGLYRITVISDGAVKSFHDVRTVGNDARVDFNLKPTAKNVKHYVLTEDSTGSHIGSRWVEVDDRQGTMPATLNSDRNSAEWARDLNRRQTNSLLGR
jgi:hypothetical protein